MRSIALLASLFALVLATGCNPEVKGLCSADDECPAEMYCEQGLCIAGGRQESDGGSASDGGGEICSPACGPGTSCVGGICQPNDEPFVAISSPPPNGTYTAQPLPVAIRAHAPGGVTKLEVRLKNAGGTLQTAMAAPTGIEDEYSAIIDLAAPNVTDGECSLVAVLTFGNVVKDSPAVLIRVAKSGPTINVLPVEYPTRTEGHPSTGAFLRNESVVIRAVVNDEGAGLSTELPVLMIPGMEPIPGEPVAPKTFKFTFDGRQPPFDMVTGEVEFSVTAKNAIGISTTFSGRFRLSRWKWTWTKQRNLPINAAPVLTRKLLIFGSDDNYVYALRTDNGSFSWEFNTGSPVVGHIVAGDSRVYAATKEGRVYALEPADSSLTDNQRRIFRCPDATGGFGPSLREFRTGVALAKLPVSGSNATNEEALVAFTKDGRLRLLRQSAFPVPFGSGNSCVWDGPNPVGNNWPAFNANDAVVPTLVPTGNDLAVYFADMGGVVRRVTIKLESGGTGQQQTFQLVQNWSKNIGGAIHGSLPYGNFAAGAGVLAMREDSSPYGFDTGGAYLWQSPGRVLLGQSRMPSILAHGFAYAVDMNGNLGMLKLNDGRLGDNPVSLASPNTQTATAGPVAAADGRIYYASGTRLQVVAPGQRMEWIFEPTPGGSNRMYLDYATPALSCDGTLYVTASDSNCGYVHALITDSTSGVADGDWPRPMHDSRNTSNASTPLSTAGNCTD